MRARPASSGSRSLSPRRLGVALVGVFVLAYAGLASLLPSSPSGQVAAGLGAPSAPDGAAPEAANDGCDDHTPGHTCGLEAKAMLQRFQKAIEQRGAVHETFHYRDRSDVGVLAVQRQVNVGLRAVALAPGAVEALAARHGLHVARVLPGMGQALLACGDRDVGEVVRELAAEPAVRYAEPNFAARVALQPNDPFLDLEKGAVDAGVEQAWDVTRGDPQVVVALLDTGVDPSHPDLQHQLLPGYDFVNQTATLTDDNGHGTAMAGIIAAEGNNALGVVGVAHGARLLPIKVADALGVASVADVAAGIDLAIQRGARIINLSMGTPVGAQALEDAVNRALQAGIVVVAAAGNDPVHHEMFPAAYPGVLSATVLGQHGELGYEAVVAEGVDVGCPAEDVITTLPGEVYGFVGGSSSAAAFASGVAALVASRDPGLSGAQVAQVLRQAQDPIPALTGLEQVFRFGRLNARKAVDRAAGAYVDVAVTGIRLTPRKPVVGQTTTAIVEVENQGSVAVANLPVRVIRHDPSGATLDIAATTVSLAMGERRELRFAFTAPSAGGYRFEAAAQAPAGETETQDDTRSVTATVDLTAETDVRVVARTLSTPDLARGSVTATLTLENEGTAATGPIAVTGNVKEVRASSAPAAVASPLAPQTIPGLAVGAQATVSFTWTIPTPAPTGILRMTLRADGLPGELRLDDNTALLDFMLGAQGPLNALYQQSNGVDLMLDTPFRVDPGIPYLPVQVFVASKGGRTPATTLRITRTQVLVRDTPTGAPTTVFDDANGARPTTAPTGLEIVDELGVPRTGALALDPFEDRDLDMNGHHDILRMPRAALGVALNPAAVVDKYVDIDVHWDQRRALFFGLALTRSGHHRAVCRVRFSPAALPGLPGDNHYYDVHHHTIAEWYFGSALDLFCPRKAYGGPLQMVLECAYCYGAIPAPTRQAAWGEIITTDHNCFNNRTIPDPDGPDHRPPFGPQSPSQQPGLGQLEAYRTIFGPAAGEEIAFKQDVPVPNVNIPFVNQILNVLPGLPLGAHMLTYHADHVEGPWHGGGWLVSPGNPNIDVELLPLLNDLAKNRQQSQEEVFTYAAHPFGGQGWRDGNLDRAFGLDPAFRTRDEVHDTTGEFVVKGLEFFNGRGTRSLPTSQIDFNDMNPWADPTFARGSQTWDAGLWAGMTRWHDFISKTLDYSFVSDPETKFIRKIYQAGGSDAHGDFDFSSARMATPISIQQTYSIGDETWYGVRTYCLGDGKPGATSQERWLAAYGDGNTVTTDGPLLTFALDADRHFDSAKLQWHDGRLAAEDADGRIGGDGPLDGGYTALVRRGSDAPGFRYRYTSSDEWGPIASVKLYKTEAGAPNPTRSRGNYDQIVGVNDLALGGADQDLEQPLDPAKEGPVTKLTAFAAGAYTGGDPDQVDLGPDQYRCYTNPVFAAPYDVDVTVSAVDSATGTIPAGALQVRWTFDISMQPRSYAVEVKALDGNGDSTDLISRSITRLSPTSGTGWSDRPGVKSSVLTLTNQGPIPLSGDQYPAAGQVSFVVFWRDPPCDAAGNALNPIATTFSSSYMAAPATTGTTAAPATAAPGTTSSGGGGGSGSCTIARPAGSDERPLPLALLALGLLALVVRRRRGA
jgi:subtilisin family serine protease